MRLLRVNRQWENKFIKMGQDLLSLIKLETKRLIWFIGITFALILAFQYLQLPYGNILLNLFYTSKIPLSGGEGSFQTAQPPLKSEIFDNKTSLNNNDSYSIQGDSFHLANNTETEIVPNSGFVLKPEMESDKFLGLLNESDKVSVVESGKKSDNGSVTKHAEGGLGGHNIFNITMPSSSQNKTTTSFSPPPAIEPTHPPLANSNNTIPQSSNDSNISSVTSSKMDESFRPLQNDDNVLRQNSSVVSVVKESKDSHVTIPEVTSISEMNKLLLQSHVSYHSMRPLWSSAVDGELMQARWKIENAPIVNNDPILYPPLYQNFSRFKRSYELMEEGLKVYIYREGSKPILHSPFLSGIYASEGWFMKLMEANERFVTKDPKKAHLFYLPFSSRMLEEALYVRNSHSHKNLIQFLNNYVGMIGEKYPFWNRTGGADHFLAACHDWAPAETRELMVNCIRALCNADVKEGFVFGKDASLPETYVVNSKNPTKDVGGFRMSKRTNLAFFAGSMHGYVRPILLQHWENKDPDMKIFGRLAKSRGNKEYINYMKSSKYCICAKGYEVNSPRVVEAIFYECVPVIISDNFVPPFLEVLNWESFAVFVMEKDIPNLKNILLSISTKSYLRMQMRVKKVQRHFLWHAKPVKYDVFHMILHSVWYNRVFSLTPS